MKDTAKAAEVGETDKQKCGDNKRRKWGGGKEKKKPGSFFKIRLSFRRSIQLISAALFNAMWRDLQRGKYLRGEQRDSAFRS